MTSGADILREVRTQAGLSQAELARRAGTSQATLSSYEHGRKQPSASTLARVVAAAGWRLTAVPAEQRTLHPSAEQARERGRQLEEVMELAEALPTRHDPVLRFPPLLNLRPAH